MIIKELILTDFQKHKHLVLNFSPDTNVIYGRTDCGKSTIIRAIRWALYPSELRGDVVKREGSKKTSVKMVLDNNIIIERIKTSSTNSYKLSIGDKTDEFNATGNKLPEEIAKIIKFAPIEIDKENVILNISNQLSLPFLMDKSGSFRQKFFNKLTGNDIIDRAFQSFNKDLLQVGRDERTEKERIEELVNQLKLVKTDKDKLSKVYKEFGILLNSVKEKNKRYEKLTSLLNNLEEVCEDIRVCSERIRIIKIIDKEKIKILEQNINKFNTLTSLNNKFLKVDNDLIDVNYKLKKIIIPEINDKKLSKKIDKFINLEKLNKKLIQIITDKENIIIGLASVTIELQQLNDKFKKMLKEMDICPFYNKPCPLNEEVTNGHN